MRTLQTLCGWCGFLIGVTQRGVMSDGYLDELEVIKDFGFNSYPIYELSMLLASDLNRAGVISILNQQDYEEIQIEDLITNVSYINKLLPHVKDIAKKITRSIEEGEIKALYMRKDFESGEVDVNNTLISFEQFNVFLDIYDLQQHIIWNEDESASGLRVEQEHQFFYQAIEKIRVSKKYATTKVTKAKFEELYEQYKDKLDNNPEFTNHIFLENIELQNKLRKLVASSSTFDKPVNSRIENNYLRLIMALANGIKDFNPTKPYEAAQLIIDETGIKKIKLQTIADYISKAHALDSKEKG